MTNPTVAPSQVLLDATDPDHIAALFQAIAAVAGVHDFEDHEVAGIISHCAAALNNAPAADSDDDSGDEPQYGPAPAGCNCGYGGFHEELNKRCAAYDPALDYRIQP